ncbi:MAG: hypothetical protein WBK67_02385 [Minisyncoccales bacterium]
MFKFLMFTVVATEFTKLGFIGSVEGVKIHSFDVNVVALESDDEAKIDELIAMQPEETLCVEITQAEFHSKAVTSSQYARVKQRVEEVYNAEVAAIASTYPLHERETWVTQIAQAKAFQASGNVADVPFLNVLALAEGGSVADFANAVLAKSVAYEMFMATKLADKRKLEKELLAEIGIA